jgi:hypothetical protein
MLQIHLRPFGAASGPWRIGIFLPKILILSGLSARASEANREGGCLFPSPSHGDDGNARLRFFSRRIFLVLLIFSEDEQT